SALRIRKPARKGTAWLLALDGRWVSVSYTTGLDGVGIGIEATQEIKPGMSGSPILAEGGAAIGLISADASTIDSNGLSKPERSGPQPTLMHHLPGWLLPPPSPRETPP